MIAAALALVAQLAHFALAIAALAVAWHVARRPQVQGLSRWAVLAPLILTAVWALSQAGFGAGHPATLLCVSLGYLAWLWLLYRLFPVDRYNRGQRLVRPLVMALALVEMLQLALVGAVIGFQGEPGAGAVILRFGLTFRLLFAAGALFLVHNLYVSASSPTRGAIRWPASAMALMWLYDLNLATLSYLGERAPAPLVAGRAVAMLAVVLLMGLAFTPRGSTARFRPSRSFAFSSVSLLAIGGYLAVMLAASQALRWFGPDMAWMVQAGFLVLASAAALLVLPSARLRGRVRVGLAKHLFQHRYDYRAEWMRFTATMGKEGHETLHRRIVQAVADITDSPGGALLLPADGGGLELCTTWLWEGLELPTFAALPDTTHFLEQRQFIVDLDDLRLGHGEQLPPEALPAALMGVAEAWVLVPLLHYDRLVGAVVLKRPLVRRRLDWEDLDLLRVVGRQLASYLAEQAGQQALGEAQQFDEFNRRIAFVIHDIKNLASQFALLAHNAERHAGNPAFRADMLVTLRSSSDKLQGLLARLGRYRAQSPEVRSSADVLALLDAIAARYAGRHPVLVTNRKPVTARINPEALEQALAHLVDNAVDASAEGAPVLLDLDIHDDELCIAVIDSGKGMSPEFLRNRLFRPFQSSKPGGFGIGACEARELVRGMAGRLDVESREGLGTRFVVKIPFEGETTVGTLPEAKVA